MSDAYTLKYFREHYIESRGIAEEDKTKIEEAFMGGAHTLMLMMTNFLSKPDPKPSIRQLTQELHEYMALKKAEVQVKEATIH